MVAIYEKIRPFKLEPVMNVTPFLTKKMPSECEPAATLCLNDEDISFAAAEGEVTTSDDNISFESVDTSCHCFATDFASSEIFVTRPAALSYAACLEPSV